MSVSNLLYFRADLGNIRWNQGIIHELVCRAGPEVQKTSFIDF